MAIDEKKLKEDVKKYFAKLKAHNVHELVELFFEDIIGIIDEQPKISLENKTSDNDVTDNNVEKMNREFEELEVTYTPDDLCTYPEYRGKPYFAIKYKENGEHFVGYGTYNPKVLSQYLRDYFMPLAMPKESKWIPCSERVPESSMYSVLGWDALRERCCFVKYYKGEWLLRGRFDYENINIIAWMPLPPAYDGAE